MKTMFGRPIATLTLLVVFGGVTFSQHQSVTSVDSVLRAHGGWKVVPLSIQITGTSTRDGNSAPVQITATSRDEVAYQYGDQRRYVATPESHFEADSTRMMYEPAPSGFAQLDVTSVFALSQLSRRRITPAEPERLASGRGVRVRVRGERHEWHYRRFQVVDQLDLDVDDSGLLEGISRTFYADEPRWKRTVSTRFGSYRETQGVLLPYRIERYEDGRLIETIVVDSYAFDVPVRTDLFARGRMR